MNNERIAQKSWWKRNWKWLVPVSSTVLILIIIAIPKGIIGIGADFAQAYSDTELYENALEKVKSNQKVVEILGGIETIDKLAILEGEVYYTNENKTVNSTIRIKGTNGSAKMDITAYRINNKWTYKKINIRITNPPESKQTIKVIKAG